MAEKKSTVRHAAELPVEDILHMRAALGLLETASGHFVLFRGLFDMSGDVAKVSPEDTRRAAVVILDLLERASEELFNIDPGGNNSPWKFASTQLRELWDAFSIVATVCASLEGGRYPDGRAVVGCPVIYAMNPAKKIVDRMVSALRRKLASIPGSSDKPSRAGQGAAARLHAARPVARIQELAAAA